MKKKNINYGKWFTEEEFMCKCGCYTTRMDQKFVDTLNKLRDLLDRPMKINSGYRCPAHPESVKYPGSSHIKGVAVDIACEDSGYRRRVIRMAEDLWVNRIGISGKFLHLDLDVNKAPAYWHYN